MQRADGDEVDAMFAQPMDWSVRPVFGGRLPAEVLGGGRLESEAVG